MLQTVKTSQNNADALFRIQANDGSSFNKIFGSGIAYPPRTRDGMTNPDPLKPLTRAESYQVYQNLSADTLLKQIIPKDKIFINEHYERDEFHEESKENSETSNSSENQASIKLLDVHGEHGET